jgi:hypothetical protein
MIDITLKQGNMTYFIREYNSVIFLETQWLFLPLVIGEVESIRS